jgi:hypothetical protein
LDELTLIGSDLPETDAEGTAAKKVRRRRFREGDGTTSALRGIRRERPRLADILHIPAAGRVEAWRAVKHA